MPKRHDTSKILVLGSGPIVIGHRPNFGYFGVDLESGFERARLQGAAQSAMKDLRL